PNQDLPSLTQNDGLVVVRSFTNGRTLKHAVQIFRQQSVTSSPVLTELRKDFFKERRECTFGCKVENEPFDSIRENGNVADGALKVRDCQARLRIAGHKKCGRRVLATTWPASNFPVWGTLQSKHRSAISDVNENCPVICRKGGD